MGDGDHSVDRIDPTPASRSWTVDTVRPTVTLSTPAEGAAYAPNQLVIANYSCADEGSSGITTCQGSVPEGSPIDTSTPGTHTFTVFALDKAQNRTEVTHSYTVRECTIMGTEGADVLEGTAGADTICGLGGNDTILGGVGEDSFDGGPGTDTASFRYSATGVKASLTTNSATGEGSDTLSAIEDLSGSGYYDELVGSIEANRLDGSGGGDRLNGRGGSDTFYGGGGNDKVWGGSGNDTIVGESGADTLLGEYGEDALDSRDGKVRNDTLDGGRGRDGCVTDARELSVVNCER